MFQSNLNEISGGRHKSKEQKSALENFKLLYESREAVIKLFNNYSSIVSWAKYKPIHGVIQKATKATCDLIGNKTAKKITKVPKNLQQNNLETIANENDKEIPKERYMPPEKRQETFDDLRLK